MLYTAPPSAEADLSAQMPPNDGSNTRNITIESPAKRLSASISRFASTAQKFGKDRTVLPRYEGSEAKAG